MRREACVGGRVGFTLIELLVVIAVIAVLVAILLPVLGSSRTAARNAICMSNQRQLSIALMSYTNDSEGLLPNFTVEEGSPRYEVLWEGPKSSIDTLDSYGQVHESAKCPLVSERQFNFSGEGPRTTDGRMFVGWFAEKELSFAGLSFFSMGLDYAIVGGSTDSDLVTGYAPFTPATVAVTTTEVPAPKDVNEALPGMVLLADINVTDGGSSVSNHALERYVPIVLNQRLGDTEAGRVWTNSNRALVDGSVSTIPARELGRDSLEPVFRFNGGRSITSLSSPSHYYYW